MILLCNDHKNSCSRKSIITYLFAKYKAAGIKKSDFPTASAALPKGMSRKAGKIQDIGRYCTKLCIASEEVLIYRGEYVIILHNKYRLQNKGEEDMQQYIKPPVEVRYADELRILAENDWSRSTGG